MKLKNITPIITVFLVISIVINIALAQKPTIDDFMNADNNCYRLAEIKISAYHMNKDLSCHLAPLFKNNLEKTFSQNETKILIQLNNNLKNLQIKGGK
jgi:hypothetical protein